MAKTYLVKKGDTLSEIAKSNNVDISNITGMKSGNPDLIYPNEQLTIKDTGETGGAKDYASSVKDELGTPKKEEEKTGGTEEEYLSGLSKKIEEARKAMEESQKGYQTTKSTAYETRYAKSELPKIKESISALDQEIAQKRAARDEAINNVRKNPNLSAAVMTGTIGKMTDKLNADINNLIQQRNSVAGTYNTGLAELENLVGSDVGGAEAGYTSAAKALESLTGEAKDYRTALLDALKQKQTKEYQDKQLEIALINANKNAAGSSALTLVRDSSGMPLYWYDKYGNIIPLDSADLQNIGAGEGGDLFANTDTGETPAVAKTGTANWWNPFSWANYF